jgi:hypothetical protein
MNELVMVVLVPVVLLVPATEKMPSLGPFLGVLKIKTIVC